MASRAVVRTAVVGAILAAFYIVVTLRSSWARATVTGSSFYPLLVGGLLLLGAVGTGLEEVFRRSQPAEAVEWPSGSERRRILAVTVVALGYATLLNYLGYLLSASLVSLVVLHVMGMKSWLVKILLSVALGIGSLYLFGNLLGIPLPAGIWAG